MRQRDRKAILSLIAREIKKGSGVSEIVGQVTAKFDITPGGAEDALQIALEQGIGQVGGFQ